MYNSIQYFAKYGIPELEENQKKFMRSPSSLGECASRVKQIMLEFGCQILSEMLEECNTILEDSMKRRTSWQIKDRAQKHLLTSLGTIAFTHTRFQNKHTKETTYLLDRMMKLDAHTRLSPDAEVCLLEEAARSSYQRAGETSCAGERVSRETVMRHVHGLSFPSGTEQKAEEKRRVKRLYVEADEDHIALQFRHKKGDVRRWKGHGDNGQIVKLVYVHEGYEEEDAERKKLKEVMYFGGIYGGKENEALWKEVKDYIENHYDTETLEMVYFQSDGGSWMKKGMEMLGGTFVLDGFHVRKYIKKMVKAAGAEEEEKEVLEYVEKGEKKRLREWVEKRKQGSMDERAMKRLEDSMGYIEKNWRGLRRRVKGEKGVIGSSTESHVSHVLSSRMSSRPMGWSRDGAGKLSKLRIYWKNGRKIEELLHSEAGGEKPEEETGSRCFSAHEMLNWESRTRKKNGKYVEVLQAHVSRQTGMKVYFQEAIMGIC